MSAFQLTSVRVGQEGKTEPSATAPHGRRKVFLQTEWSDGSEAFVLSGFAWSRTPLTSGGRKNTRKGSSKGKRGSRGK